MKILKISLIVLALASLTACVPYGYYGRGGHHRGGWHHHGR